MWVNATRDVHLGTAAGFGLLRVKDGTDPFQWFEAGRAWQRLSLAATGAGLALHPLNQMPEVADRDRQLGRASPIRVALNALGTGNGDVVMAFRYGWPGALAAPSARRPLDAVLLSGSASQQSTG